MVEGTEFGLIEKRKSGLRFPSAVKASVFWFSEANRCKGFMNDKVRPYV